VDNQAGYAAFGAAKCARACVADGKKHLREFLSEIIEISARHHGMRQTQMNWKPHSRITFRILSFSEYPRWYRCRRRSPASASPKVQRQGPHHRHAANRFSSKPCSKVGPGIWARNATPLTPPFSAETLRERFPSCSQRTGSEPGGAGERRRCTSAGSSYGTGKDRRRTLAHCGARHQCGCGIKLGRGDASLISYRKTKIRIYSNCRTSSLTALSRIGAIWSDRKYDRHLNQPAGLFS